MSISPYKLLICVNLTHNQQWFNVFLKLESNRYVPIWLLVVGSSNVHRSVGGGGGK